MLGFVVSCNMFVFMNDAKLFMTLSNKPTKYENGLIYLLNQIPLCFNDVMY